MRVFREFAEKVLVVLMCGALSACSSHQLSQSLIAEPPQLDEYTTVSNILKTLPPPAQPVTAAVYRFDDKTGQHKPSDDFPEYSRAVTQGGASILAKALYDAGNGAWFSVLEREGLTDLAQERKIIRATREEYRAPGGQKLGNLGPLLYAGVLLHGGIIAYESDTVTGGFGARYLGIGGTTEYRRDVVTVALRAVSVRTGQVVLAVNTSKTIFLSAVDGNLFRFTSLDELLQIESGVTFNEPPQFAARQAIELAVYSLVMEGAEKGLWQFADPILGKRLVGDYVAKRDRQKSVITHENDGSEYSFSSLSDFFDEQFSDGDVSSAASTRLPPPKLPASLVSPAQKEVDGSDARIPIKQLPPSSTQTSSGGSPIKKVTRVSSEAEFREILKEAIANQQTTQENSEIPSESGASDGINRGQTIGSDGQILYCGPSGCLPTYETIRPR